jgi:hypothetical protein
MADGLRIDPEFAALCRQLTTQESALLESQLEEDGCRDPIVTWANHEDTILDGHNRYRICTALGIKFKTVALNIPDREAAKRWIHRNQIGKRNATPDEIAYHRGKLYEAEKKDEGGRADRDFSGGNNCPPKTADALADEFGVSPKTIKNDAAFSRGVDAIAEAAGPDAKAAVLSGKANKKDVIAVGREKDTGKKSQAAKAVAAVSTAPKSNGAAVKAEPTAKKKADFTAVCRWASGRKQAITADEAAEKFDLSVDGMKRALNAAAQSQGYIIRQLPKEGRDKDEYRITRAVHFGKLDLPADSAGGTEDMKLAAKELRDLALTYRDKTSAKRCSTWTPEEQEKLLSLCITLANAFVEG